MVSTSPEQLSELNEVQRALSSLQSKLKTGEILTERPILPVTTDSSKTVIVSNNNNSNLYQLERREKGLSIQDKGAQLWREYSGDELLLLPRFSKFDYLAFDSKNLNATRLLEVRSRNIPVNTYTTFYINRERYWAIEDLKSLTGLNTLFMAVFLDAAGYIELPYNGVRHKRPRDNNG